VEWGQIRRQQKSVDIFLYIYSMVLAEKTALTWLLILKTAESQLSHAPSKDCSNHLKRAEPSEIFFTSKGHENETFSLKFFQECTSPKLPNT
jgi:hypothetical protein